VTAAITFERLWEKPYPGRARSATIL